jgi:hypothetical protein
MQNTNLAVIFRKNRELGETILTKEELAPVADQLGREADDEVSLAEVDGQSPDVSGGQKGKSPKRITSCLT